MSLRDCTVLGARHCSVQLMVRYSAAVVARSALMRGSPSCQATMTNPFIHETFCKIEVAQAHWHSLDESSYPSAYSVFLLLPLTLSGEHWCGPERSTHCVPIAYSIHMPRPSSDILVSSLPILILPSPWPSRRTICHYLEVCVYHYFRPSLPPHKVHDRFTLNTAHWEAFSSPRFFRAILCSSSPFLVYTNIFGWPNYYQTFYFFLPLSAGCREIPRGHWCGLMVRHQGERCRVCWTWTTSSYCFLISSIPAWASSQMYYFHCVTDCNLACLSLWFGGSDNCLSWWCSVVRPSFSPRVQYWARSCLLNGPAPEP